MTVDKKAALCNRDYCRGTHPSFFSTVGYHDDAFHSLFPDHLPEIIQCRWQRTLSGNVLSVAVVALQSSRSSGYLWTCFVRNIKVNDKMVQPFLLTDRKYLLACNWHWCSLRRWDLTLTASHDTSHLGRGRDTRWNKMDPQLESAVLLSIIIWICGTPSIRLRAYMAVYWRNGSWICSQVKGRPFGSALYRLGWGSAGQVEDQGDENSSRTLQAVKEGKQTASVCLYTPHIPLWNPCGRSHSVCGSGWRTLQQKWPWNPHNGVQDAAQMMSDVSRETGMDLLWLFFRLFLATTERFPAVVKNKLSEHVHGRYVSYRGRTNLMISGLLKYTKTAMQIRMTKRSTAITEPAMTPDRRNQIANQHQSSIPLGVPISPHNHCFECVKPNKLEPDLPRGSVGHWKTDGSNRLTVPESAAKDTWYVVAGWKPGTVRYCSSWSLVRKVRPDTFTSTAVHTPGGLFQTILTE